MKAKRASASLTPAEDKSPKEKKKKKDSDVRLSLNIPLSLPRHISLSVYLSLVFACCFRLCLCLTIKCNAGLSQDSDSDASKKSSKSASKSKSDDVDVGPFRSPLQGLPAWLPASIYSCGPRAEHNLDCPNDTALCRALKRHQSSWQTRPRWVQVAHVHKPQYNLTHLLPTPHRQAFLEKRKSTGEPDSKFCFVLC